MAITTKQYSDLKKEIDDIKSSVDEIKTAIIGNDQFGQEGLVSVVKRHEEYIEQDRKFKQKLIGAMAVLGTLWTLILKFGESIF